ncbi:MAG TPA: SRPBCC domain-containing protein [Patescibacteria group bacterium]|jgi:uncharacterized protein YndB with AHSA1/START domain
MKKLHFTITIAAPRETVWKTMLDDATYRQWTAPFSPDPSTDSSYEGSWEQGSDIRFVAPNKQGKPEGMYARIAENRPHEFVSIQHIGEVRDGTEHPYPEPAFENYTFEDDGDGTKLTVDLDSDEKYADMFDDLWPKALEKLKQIAEAA